PVQAAAAAGHPAADGARRRAERLDRSGDRSRGRPAAAWAVGGVLTVEALARWLVVPRWWLTAAWDRSTTARRACRAPRWRRRTRARARGRRPPRTVART